MTYEELLEHVTNVEAPILLNAIDAVNNLHKIIALNLTTSCVCIQQSNSVYCSIANQGSFRTVIDSVNNSLNLGEVVTIRYSIQTRKIIITTETNKIYYKPSQLKFKLINLRDGSIRKVSASHIELEIKLIEALINPLVAKINYITEQHTIHSTVQNELEDMRSRYRHIGMPRSPHHPHGIEDHILSMSRDYKPLIEQPPQSLLDISETMPIATKYSIGFNSVQSPLVSIKI